MGDTPATQTSHLPTSAAALAAAAGQAAAANTSAVEDAAYKAVKAVTKANPDAEMSEVRRAVDESLATAADADSTSEGEGGDGNTDTSTTADSAGDAKDGVDAEAVDGDKGDKPKAGGGETPPATPRKVTAELGKLKPEDRARYAQAERALLRDNYDADDIAGLIEARGVENVIKLGLKRKDAQDKAARAFARQSGANQAKDKQGPSTEAEPAIEVEGDPDDEAGALDADPANAEGADEDLDDLTPKQRKLVAAERARADKAEQQLVTTRVHSSAQKLSADFPGLKKPDGLRQVCAQMDVLDPSGESVKDPKKLEGLMRSAAWVVFGDQIKSTALRDRQRQTEETLDGQPEVPRRGGSDARAMSDEEYDRRAFEAVRRATKNGGDISDSRRELAKVS